MHYNIVSQQCKGKYQRAVLYVSGDALRVVDEMSKVILLRILVNFQHFCLCVSTQAPSSLHPTLSGQLQLSTDTLETGAKSVRSLQEAVSVLYDCCYPICCTFRTFSFYRMQRSLNV